VPFATPVRRHVERIEVPSTRQAMTWVRFSEVRRFILTIMGRIVRFLIGPDNIINRGQNQYSDEGRQSPQAAAKEKRPGQQRQAYESRCKLKLPVSVVPHIAPNPLHVFRVRVAATTHNRVRFQTGPLPDPAMGPGPTWVRGVTAMSSAPGMRASLP
jgi:hypothetical protein